MAILSIDLAYKCCADIGVVVMEQDAKSVNCELIDVRIDGPLSCQVLGDWIDSLCLRRGIRITLLDGPQGWKARDNGLAHSRCCERKLNTPAKTGEPSFVKPFNYTSFVKFSIGVYDALASLGWERLCEVSTTSPAKRLLIESFPLSAWTSLKIPNLPAKSKRPDVGPWLETLQRRFAVRTSSKPTHDQLQAIVSGLAGIAVESGRWDECEVVGSPPVSEDGCWCEGFIVNPLYHD